MDDVKKVFNEGAFMSKDTWQPVPESQVPKPRPGQCVADSASTNHDRVIFTRDKPFMANLVTPMWGGPMLVQTVQKFRFTKIAVDPQVETVQGNRFDVLFIGTTDGKVLKAINSASYAGNGHEHYNQSVPIIIDETTVFPHRPIINILVYKTLLEAKLVVISDDDIVNIPLSTCETRATTCGQCVALQDPYCAWDGARNLCTAARIRGWSRQNFIQNVEAGWDPSCADGRPPPQQKDLKKKGDENDLREYEEKCPGVTEPCSSDAVNQYFAAETLAFSVVTSVVSSLVIGFILGYIFSKRFKKEDPNLRSPYGDQPLYMDRRIQRPPPSKTYGGMGQETLNKPINLVLNVPTKNGKNVNSSVDNNLIQKVKTKKVYL